MARRPRQVGHGDSASWGRARDDRGQRRRRRSHGRLPRPRRSGHHPGRQHPVVRRRQGDVRADLRGNIAGRRRQLPLLLDEADAYVARNGLDLPEEPAARVFGPDPGCVTNPLRELDLRRGRRHVDHLGDRLLHRLRLAEGRRLRRERQAAAPARRLQSSLASTSSGCPGSRAAARASSGASGTTRSTSPTTSRSSGPTPRTASEGEVARHAGLIFRYESVSQVERVDDVSSPTRRRIRTAQGRRCRSHRRDHRDGDRADHGGKDSRFHGRQPQRRLRRRTSSGCGRPAGRARQLQVPMRGRRHHRRPPRQLSHWRRPKRRAGRQHTGQRSRPKKTRTGS